MTQQLPRDLGAPSAPLVAEKKYQSLLERLPDVVWTIDDKGRIAFVTANVKELSGFRQEEVLIGGIERWLERVHDADVALARSAYRALLEEQKLFDIEYRWRRRNNQWIWVRDRVIAVSECDGGRSFDGIFSEITEVKRLEESLRQAQKMEAIGQLTGGIAHDFNNILAVILANSYMLIEDLGDDDPRQSDAKEIKAAAESAVALTRQLLAFSRRQVLQATVVNLNATVSGIEKMLRRLIGEDIELKVSFGDDLGTIQVDVSQIEQVIMNLVVNARDAMPTGGKLSIETANFDADVHFALSHAPMKPGNYVMLAVTDTGCGMDPETKRRIFEPFFTTKELGKGTGLGLSTCYGIVKQSNGFIWAQSEPGQGTSFKIYLPRINQRPTEAPKRLKESKLEGNETILVIEDDDLVRSVIARMLGPRGYQLLLARNGLEAVALAGSHDAPIHLVLSDVIMPGSSGPEVVAQLRERCTETRVMFMSGYTEHPVLRDGVLQAGINFIQKPFTPEALVRKVREVLDD